MIQTEDIRIDTDIHHNRWTKYPLAVIGLIGICYLIWKITALQGEDLTFKYIWFSGNLWLDGQSPYGPEYLEIGHKLFTGFNGQPFYYPPNWWIISTFFASFEYSHAMEIWRVLNGVFILSGTLLLHRGLRHAGINLSIGHLIFYTGLISLMQITPVILATGQTSLLIYFGICLLAYSILADRRWVLVTALCIVVLKPQIGVPLMAALLPFRQYHYALLVASFTTVLITIPALVSNGPIATITLFLKGLSKHSEFVTNSPANSTGLKNILINIFATEASSMFLTAISIVALLLIGFYFKRQMIQQKQKPASNTQVSLLIALLISVAFLAPLHEYDMIIIAPILVLTACFGNRLCNILLIMFCIMLRPGNIASVIGINDVDDTRAFVAIMMTTALALMSMLIYIQVTKNKNI